MWGEPLEKIKQVREGPQHLRRLIQTLFTRAKNHKRGLCMTRSLLLAEKLMQHDICVSDCSLQNLPRKHPRDRFKGKRVNRNIVRCVLEVSTADFYLLLPVHVKDMETRFKFMGATISQLFQTHLPGTIRCFRNSSKSCTLQLLHKVFPICIWRR